MQISRAHQKRVSHSVIFVLVSTALSALCPVIDDNFSSPQLDSTVWQTQNTMNPGGNSENQWYSNSPSNVYIKDSTLHLTPTLTFDAIGNEMYTTAEYTLKDCTDPGNFGCAQTPQNGNILPPVQSGKITSKVSIKYGDWFWPAIWLLPTKSVYGEWPASGEIDIMESRGNVAGEKGQTEGKNTVGSDLIWPDTKAGRYHTGFQSKVDYSLDYHTYGLLWTATTLTYYVDTIDNVILKVDQAAPFDQDFYLILNLAVGGTFFQNPLPSKEFWAAKDTWYPTWQNTADPLASSFRIKSVKMWQEQDVCSGVVAKKDSTTPLSSGVSNTTVPLQSQLAPSSGADVPNPAIETADPASQPEAASTGSCECK